MGAMGVPLHRSICLALLILVGGCVQSGRDIPREDKLLATVPDGVWAYWITFSRDGRVVAYIDRSTDSHRIVTNGKPGKPVGFL